MPSEQQRLTLDEGAEHLFRQYGLPLTAVGLSEVCESGWAACRLDERGGWSIDREALASGDTPRELAERIARLAAEREDAEDTMEQPPAGAEADLGI